MACYRRGRELLQSDPAPSPLNSGGDSAGGTGTPKDLKAVPGGSGWRMLTVPQGELRLVRVAVLELAVGMQALLSRLVRATGLQPDPGLEPGNT